jgi:Na+-translocating ferredoxin:NAD+ oxidoreductase subunit D
MAKKISTIPHESCDGVDGHHLLVSVSPHLKTDVTTARIMWTVVACLMPPLVLSVFVFGFQTLIITAVSVLSCVATEAVSQKLLGRPITVKDGSAVITGILLAYVIPPGVPLWMPVLGAVMAIFVTKIVMGGLGFNIFNPALIGRAFLVATYPVAMTTAWLSPSATGRSSETWARAWMPCPRPRPSMS